MQSSVFYFDVTNINVNARGERVSCKEDDENRTAGIEPSFSLRRETGSFDLKPGQKLKVTVEVVG